jgi:hypothetical protein
MVSVRAATEQDAGAISHVHVQSWRTTYTGVVPEAYLDGLNETERVPLWREWLTRDIQVFVADSDEWLQCWRADQIQRSRGKTRTVSSYAKPPNVPYLPGAQS